VHVHPGQIIHAVGVRDELNRRDVLADLLGAAVQIAQVRSDLGDDLAIGPQHQPQHAVSAGMLRPHVDEHLVGANVEFNDGGVYGGFGYGGHVIPVEAALEYRIQGRTFLPLRFQTTGLSMEAPRSGVLSFSSIAMTALSVTSVSV